MFHEILKKTRPVAGSTALTAAAVVFAASQVYALLWAAGSIWLDWRGHGAVRMLVAAYGLFLVFLVARARRRISSEAERAETLAEHISHGMLFIERGRIAYANPLARRLLASRKGAQELTPVIAALLEQVKTSHAPVPHEATLDGQTRHFLVSRISKRPSALSAGDRQMYLFQDVTLLRESEEAKVNFIGSLSHEIKTPITSLSMALAMLERSGYDAELLRVASSDVKRLRLLLDDLLDVSRLKLVRDATTLRLRDTDLTSLMLHTANSLAGAAAARGVRITTSVEPFQHIYARIDPTRFSWVLSTLLNEALRQTPGGETITLTLSLESDCAVLEIRHRRGAAFPTSTMHELITDIIEGHAGRCVSLHHADRLSQVLISLPAYSKTAPTLRGHHDHEAHLAC